MALRTATATTMAMGLGVLVLAAGTACSAEVPGEQSDDVVVSPTLGGVEEKADPLFGVCTAAQVQSHVTATKLVQYVFGDDSKAPPSTAGACSNLKAALQQVRTIVASPTTQIFTAQMGDSACGGGSRPDVRPPRCQSHVADLRHDPRHHSGERRRLLPRPGAAAACGRLVGGEPCSTTALAIGSTSVQMIVKTGAICTCR